MSFKIIIPLFLIVLLFLLREDLSAQYIDPGTGSYLFQMLIAGILAFLIYLKKPIAFLKSFLKKIYNKNNNLSEK